MSERFNIALPLFVGDILTEENNVDSHSRWVVEEVKHNNQYVLRYQIDKQDSVKIVWTAHEDIYLFVHRMSTDYVALSPIERKIREMENKRKALGYKW